MDDIPKASGMWHVHGVDVGLVEEWCGGVDGGWKVDFGGLTDLALVTSLNIPLDVGLKGWPPEAVKEGAACGVEALVA